MDLWRDLEAGAASFRFVSLAAADDAAGGAISRLPVCLKILAENVLRHAGAHDPLPEAVLALAARRDPPSGAEIPFHPSRILMPDSSGLPLIADLAAMRDAATGLGVDPGRINPKIPVDLVIDHSVIVDVAGQGDAADRNLALEFERNEERYRLVAWAQGAFDGLSVVPPGNGICHQINLERLASVVRRDRRDGREVVSFDTLVGMDSHTPMVNSLGVLGWGVGGIEAATVMLGEPIGLRVPKVVGCRLVGALPRIASTTDLVLTVTQRLREVGVVGAFVEFCGPGVRSLSVPQRATLSNMAPEYGATIGLFAIDRETLRFLTVTGREAAHVDLVELYARAQGAWAGEDVAEPDFSQVVEIDLASVEPSAAGPRRPQDRVPLGGVPASFRAFAPPREESGPDRPRDGDVVIAAITSCTNTSNPSVMIEAGLLARNAVARGLATQPWVKASLAPGSRVVADYLEAAGLQDPLDALGFNIAGFGCTTCMGNSGPLAEPVAAAIGAHDATVCAVLSGNRNFEGRIHNLARASYLVSPALVVAYALAGSVLTDLTREPLGHDPEGRPVYLADIRPDPDEVETLIARHVGPDAFLSRYSGGFDVPEAWRRLSAEPGRTYDWDPGSTFIRRPPFLDDLRPEPERPADIAGARALLILGDSITTDHISPVSQIPASSSAGRYLAGLGTEAGRLGSFMARRVNHDVMLRGTFANPRLANEMTPGQPGGVTRHVPSDRLMSVDEAAALYAEEGTPLVVVAGADYGAGSSRDWAAKGTLLLGIRAILAENFERIHRSNLLGMGVAPLEFLPGTTRETLGLDGSESFDIRGLATIAPRQQVEATIRRRDGSSETIRLLCRIDTERELAWFRNGGILPLAMRELAQAA